MNAELRASYQVCQRLARRSGSNFYFAFLLLPPAKRAAMYVLYAFLRRTDDLGDNSRSVSARRAALESWRSSFDRALAGQFDGPIFPALAETVSRFQIPIEYLTAAIDGVEMDLDHTRYETFADLENYCYHVASAVGLACIHVWGFQSEAAFEPARQCGIAFQLTNILRDLKEDANAGRIYLPQEDLARFRYTDEDLLGSVRDERFRALMEFQIARTEGFYRQAARLPEYLAPDGRRAFGAMLGTYRSLLDQIKRRRGDVLSARVRLSNWRKLRIVIRSLLSEPRQPAAAPPVGALPQ